MTTDQDISGTNQSAPSRKKGYKNLVFTMILALAVAVVLIWLVIRNFHELQDRALAFKPRSTDHFVNTGADLAKLDAYQQSVGKDLAATKKKLDNFIPKQHYLVVNTSDNDFRLYKGNELVRKGICSTGSYTVLQAGDKQEWIFKTPRGMFKIQGKITNPTWRKPDWAFVEEGLPIPPPGDPSRIETGVLGDYAMSIGDGYLIHGTLYKRFLGMPVTHGCIRLGDDDLEYIYNNLETGSKVYIY
jgi:hypothetical protein